MRIFIDTEFLRAKKRIHLLSIGLVADSGHELYLDAPPAEVPPMSDHFLSEFVRHSVLPQFGLVAGATTPRAEMPDRLTHWLSGLAATEIELNFDFAADYELLRRLMPVNCGGLPRIAPQHEGFLMDDPAGKAAADAAWLDAEATLGIRRHHALADSLALQARCHAAHQKWLISA